MNEPISKREFRGLERKVESLAEENKKLRECLVHVAKGGKLDCVTGEPLPEIHLSVVGIGRISSDTALTLLHDESRETTDAETYCIAEAACRVLRYYHIPVCGSSVEGVDTAIKRLWDTVGNDVARILNVWRSCGGSPEYPASDLHCHVPAWKVLRNSGYNGLREPAKQVA